MCQQIWFLSPSAREHTSVCSICFIGVSRSGSFHRRRAGSDQGPIAYIGCQQIWFLSPSARRITSIHRTPPEVSADLVPFTVGEWVPDCTSFATGACQQIWFLSPSASRYGRIEKEQYLCVSRSGSFHRRRELAFLRLIFKCDLSILRAPCRYKFPDHFVAVVISNSGRLIKVISSRALVHVCLHHHPARRTVSRILLSSARGARGIEADDTPARFQPL